MDAPGAVWRRYRRRLTILSLLSQPIWSMICFRGVSKMLQSETP